MQLKYLKLNVDGDTVLNEYCVKVANVILLLLLLLLLRHFNSKTFKYVVKLLDVWYKRSLFIPHDTIT